jgi:epoxyqueuosine reductase
MHDNSSMVLSLEDRRWIEDRARAAGFDLAGVARIPEFESVEGTQVDARFADWVAAGYAGEMEYLKRKVVSGGKESGRLVRGDVRRAMPWASSVIVCAVNYDSAIPHYDNGVPLSIEPAEPDTGWIARYAWSGREHSSSTGRRAGSDYHDVLLAKLRAVEAELRQRFGTASEADGAVDLQTRCYVDTGPLLERGYAVRAGIGWIGKNTCVIDQEQGSWLLLGVIATSLELQESAWSVAAADRCGTCTRCIDACPTDALLLPTDKTSVRQMDASRCIAYLTIEKKGSIETELREKMGRQVFGCDICQDVCPWNSKTRKGKRPLATESMLPVRRELINPKLEWLAAMDGPEFNSWFRGSPLERTRRRRILRNVAIAMGNSREAKFLDRLKEWSASEDAVLAEAAVWAAARLRNSRTFS